MAGSRKQLSASIRAIVLAGAALACSFTATTVALMTHQATLPPTDAAYGQQLTDVWSDPFVRVIAVPVAAGGALLGFLAALWLLWKTRLSASIPVVFGVTVLAAAVSGPLSLCGAVPTLAAALWAMTWCRRRLPLPRG